MVSGRKMFNSGSRKYALQIIYLKKNILHFASKDSPQKSCHRQPAVGLGVEEENKEIENK